VRGWSGIFFFDYNPMEVHVPSVARSVMQTLYGENIWEGFALGHASEEVQGWNGNHSALQRLTSEHGGRVVVDVGVWKGQSTITLANAMKLSGIDGCVVAVDTFLGSPEHWSRLGGLFSRGASRDWGDADGSGMTCRAVAGREIMDGIGVAAGRNWG